jgi:hypothetical protein
MMSLALFNLGGMWMLLILALSTLFWIWMLVDAIQNRRLSDGEKICWVLAIIFLPFLGSLLYLLLGHSKATSA